MGRRAADISSRVATATGPSAASLEEPVFHAIEADTGAKDSRLTSPWATADSPPAMMPCVVPRRSDSGGLGPSVMPLVTEEHLQLLWF
jgi:hypothetical protein